MLTIAGLGFAHPWLLAAAALLPGLWWLLRVTPPQPTSVSFPALRLLVGLSTQSETPARTPFWLILLRIFLALLLILGLAGPVLHPSAALPGDGPLVLVIDNGWAAARNWPETQRGMNDLIARAEREGRNIVLVATATATAKDPATLLRPAQATGIAASLQPEPWPDDRAAAAKQLTALSFHDGAVYWLSDGVASDRDKMLVDTLAPLGQVELRQPSELATARLLTLGPSDTPELKMRVQRLPATGAAPVAIHAFGADGALLATASGPFPGNEEFVDLALKIPLELRNRVDRVTLDGEAGAGATLLIDSNARRGAVGIVTDAGGNTNQPLLSGAYYIGRAIEPYAELRRGSLEHLTDSGVGMLVLPDGDIAAPAARALVTGWIEKGGVLLRFAGPGLVEGIQDDLLPVTLRRGGRSLGGVMSWEKPAHLAEFKPSSPFAGLKIPADVVVQQQVLAEPSPDLDAKIWAQLSDGTPLVTAEAHGKGFVVLVHTSANPSWSNLALSGLFVEMLRRLELIGHGDAAPVAGVLPPWRMLDGFGRLVDPPATAQPLGFKPGTLGAQPDGKISALHPPGFYGTADNHAAFNLAGNIPPLRALDETPASWSRGHPEDQAEQDLRPWLLGSALLLALVDFIIGFALRGLLKSKAVRVTAALLLAFSFSVSANAASDAFAIEATKQLHFGYILTGDASTDTVSKAGLAGLDDILQRRTSVDAGDPIGIDIERDELLFFPVIYWPISTSQRPLSPQAVEKVNRYLATGGTFLIDTRDQGITNLGAGDDMSARLRTLLAGVHVPPLVPAPPNHVLTKSFYLMQDYPGRWAGGTLWVEPADDRVNDGVSTIIMGSNDWASAWAIDANGDPQFPVVPGGEAQREQAYRFGVNLVMYALTGNYKADQVHVPSILERLGQ